MDRRNFLGKAALAAGAIALAQNSFGANENSTISDEFLSTPETILQGEMIYRTLIGIASVVRGGS